jgi:hypothetical protein
MTICEIVVLTFIVTALWDVLLRVMSENYKKLPSIMKYDFVRFLQPYFKKHTLLAAALIAGFVGAVTQYVILNIVSFPSDVMNISSVVTFLFISFIISGLFGIVMKATKLFPYLDQYYYKPLGLIRSMYHDGISGLIVQITLIIMLSFNKYV